MSAADRPDPIEPGALDSPRARGERRPFGAAAPLALLLALAAALLWESLFAGKVLCAADALFQFEPWHAVAPPGHVPANPLLLDQPTVMLPWLHFAAAEIRRGELPLWNPDDYAGHPIAAAASGGLFFPLHWLYYAWPSWHWLAWFGLARLFCAGAFTLLFLRRLGLARAPALLGAQCFMLSGFLVAWLGHPHASVAMFLPALFWIAERDAQRASLLEVVALGLATGAQILGGHFQTFLHAHLAAGAYVLWRARGTSSPFRYLARWGGGLALGLALGAPQWLSFAEYLRESQASALFASFDVTGSVGLRDAAAFLVEPRTFGAPHTHDYAGPDGPNLNYAELVGAHVGKVALALALLAAFRVRRDRPARFFGALALLALLVAWQVEPFHAAARALPGLGSTKLMRLVLPAAFALAVLAARGAEALLARLGASPRTAPALAAALVLVSAAELVRAGYGFQPAIAPELVAPRTPVTEFLSRAEPRARVLALDSTSLAASANLFYGVASLSGYDSLEYRRVTELVSGLSRDPLAGLGDLLERIPADKRPRTAFLKEIRAFDRSEALPLASLLNVGYVLSLSALPPPLELLLDGPLRVYRNPHVLPRAFAARATRRFASADELLEHSRSADFDPRVALLDPSAPDELDLPAPPGGEVVGDVRIVRSEPRRLELEADLPGSRLVLVSDAWASGWHARVDGRPAEIHRVDHALRAVLAPAGRSKIEMRYDPTSVRTGLALALLGSAAALALLVAASRGRGERREREAGSA